MTAFRRGWLGALDAIGRDCLIVLTFENDSFKILVKLEEEET